MDPDPESLGAMDPPPTSQSLLTAQQAHASQSLPTPTLPSPSPQDTPQSEPHHPPQPAPPALPVSPTEAGDIPPLTTDTTPVSITVNHHAVPYEASPLPEL
ncbi:hypothetical protein BJ508DRAFT_331861 [Ascobolus immersus RN42]|uniref:Uncharacterized protein n=1 Tax=Ascobolus immersus RN42 TaxID=1160509 RepID=A0A3N4HUY9_ASCIM|nr:hypothetical protein BJ508DRAFT_331861 [Ascobolus immersus RN42]